MALLHLYFFGHRGYVVGVLLFSEEDALSRKGRKCNNRVSKEVPDYHNIVLVR